MVIVGSGLRLARARLLSARYAVGWISLGALVGGAALLMPFVGRIGRLANMTPTAVLLTLSSATLLAVTVQLSISVSQLQSRLRALAEAHALLQFEVRRIERNG